MVQYQSDLIFSPKSVVYETIAEFEESRISFESSVGLSNLLKVMSDQIPPETVEGAIDAYRRVIRGNDWFYPTSRKRRTTGLLSNWRDVHVDYFTHACAIYRELQSAGTTSVLLDAKLYRETIHSETMRGWVGKRSISGPDALLASLTDEIENLLVEAGVTDQVVDQVLHLGGLYHGDSLLLSAEEELTVLMGSFEKTYGEPLSLSNLEAAHAATDGRSSRLLRDFTKYSLADFNSKYEIYSQQSLAQFSRRSLARAEARETLDGALRGIPDVYLRARLSSLLSEVRMLNFLNLNLEVKYSFKGWAGLMHGLVFSEVEVQSWSTPNIYDNLNRLAKGA